MVERKLAFAVQGQSYGPMFDEKLTVEMEDEAIMVCGHGNDRMVPPAMEEWAAKRMGAEKTILPPATWSSWKSRQRSQRLSTRPAKTAYAATRQPGIAVEHA